MAKQTFTTGSVLTSTQMNNLQANDYNWTVSQKTASYVLVAADAGTRIEMNAAGATTVTVNTGLFSAGDTLFIQNIGTGACTVTAGTATVNKATAGSLTLSQYQGGTLYFVSASSAVFFADAGYTPPLTTKGDLFGYDTAAARIPIGSNNQVLTADSTQALGLKWATPAGAKNFSSLGTGTLTGAQTITVSGISGQDQLFIVIAGASSVNTGSIIQLRLNADTGTNYDNYFVFNVVGSTYSASNFSSNNVALAGFRVGDMSNNASSGVNGYLMLSGANTAGKKIAQWAGSGDVSGGNSQIQYIGGGVYNSTSTISSVSLFSSSGNFDAGTFTVFGSA